MIATATKMCRACDTEKPLSEFRRHTVRGKRYPVARCGPCDRAHVREYRAQNPHVAKRSNLARYGITLEEYETLKQAQGGCCAICDGLPNGQGDLHVDHDHETGRVRGLLCSNCNPGIGFFRHDRDLLAKAIEYIKVAT